MDEHSLQSTGEIVAALKILQDKMLRLERERNQSIEQVHSLRSELARRQERLKYTQQLQDIATQEQSAAVQLSYQRMLADKQGVDTTLKETEEIVRDLKKSCESARDRAQGAQVSQWEAEAKCSVLERQVKEREKEALARDEMCLRTRKNVRRETAAAEARLDALSGQVEKLRRAVRDERFSREAAGRDCRQARDTYAQTRRYLDNILRVNQELVMRRTEIATRSRSMGQRPTSMQGKEGPNESQCLNGHKIHPSERHGCGIFGELHLGSAVADALRAGRAGSDPVPLLEVLYERIGFSVLQREGENSGAQSLPISPRWDKACNIVEGASSQNGENGFCSSKLPVPVNTCRFFPSECVKRSSTKDVQPFSQYKETKRTEIRKYGAGRGIPEGSNPSRHGYSFAHSPARRSQSIAERSPKVLKRLEGLAIQLKRERAGVERRYMAMIQRANSSVHKGVEDADLDFGSLARAIASLEEKSQQLEVVQESLQVMKEVPQTTQVYSPTARRRETATLDVLKRQRQHGPRGTVDGTALTKA